MNADVAQPRAPIPQNFFYEAPRRDDDQQPPASAPAQQQPQPQQPSFAAGYDAHPQDQPQGNPEGDGDDSDDQLSVQTLNADGTPKRPMNAFLLYAKKRRPQISTNHPTMRTGEISKVLSKEWQTMAKSEKQYYQDRAKKLKDTFNLRWPDYVYKRRPNNSRKKRRGIPNTDSPVVEDPSRRDSEGAENDGYGDGSGGDDAEGSPSLVVRVPHDRHPDEVRMGMPYGSGPAPQGDPRAPPSSASGAAINSRMPPYPPNPTAPGGYPYDEQYNQYPYYASNGSSAPPSRLPPVWNQHDASRSPYDTPRSASTGYSPVNEDGQQQQWQAGRPGNPSPITTSWQNPMHNGPQNTAQGVTAPRGPPGVVGQRSSADNSPIQPSSDFRGANRPPPTPQSAGAGRSFQTLNAPMYPPSTPGSAAPRPGSPSTYSNGTYPYSGQGGPASATGNGNPVGRSPVLPGVTSLDHGYGSHQPSSNMRGDSGYSPMLPPLGASGDGRSASNPYPSPREGPSRQPGADSDRAGRPDGRDGVAANGLSHPSYWDPVKSEAGE